MLEHRAITFILPNKSDLVVTGVPNDISVHEMKAKLGSINRIRELENDFILKSDGAVLTDDDFITGNLIYIEIVPVQAKPLLVILYSFLLGLSVLGFLICYIKKSSSIIKAISVLIPLTIYAILGFIVPPPESMSLGDVHENIVLEIIHLFFRTINPAFRLEDVLINRD